MTNKPKTFASDGKKYIGYCNLCDSQFDLSDMVEVDRIAFMNGHSDLEHKKKVWTAKASPVDGKDPVNWMGDPEQRDWYIEG